MTTKKKDNRGGKREGAGRPSTDNAKVLMSVRVDRDLAEAMSSEAFMAHNKKPEYVNHALRDALLKDGFITD